MQKFYLVKMLGEMEQVMPYSPTKALGKAAGTFTENLGDGNEYNVMAAIAKHLGPLLNKDARTFILCRFDGKGFAYWVRKKDR